MGLRYCIIRTIFMNFQQANHVIPLPKLRNKLDNPSPRATKYDLGNKWQTTAPRERDIGLSNI